MKPFLEFRLGIEPIDETCGRAILQCSSNGGYSHPDPAQLREEIGRMLKEGAEPRPEASQYDTLNKMVKTISDISGLLVQEAIEGRLTYTTPDHPMIEEHTP